MSFCFLNNKSGYSFLKSSLKINDMVEYAKNNDIPFLALTDQNNMFGMMEFVHSCEKNSIKPIIGMEVILANEEIPLVLIATSNAGYSNLCKITRIVSSYDLETPITLEDLDKYKNGLICILPYIRGYMHEKTIDQKIALVNSLKHVFTSFYIGLECYGNNDLNKLEDARYFARRYQLHTVPLQEVLTLNQSTTYLLDVLKGIELITSIDKIEKVNYENHHFMSLVKIKTIFTEEEILNTVKIANICDVNLKDIKGDLVKYPLNSDVDDYDYLHALAYKGLSIRLGGRVSQKYIDRLEYELSVIKKMNFVNYFLVVYDYVKYAKMHDILVGPGRGSAGGCLVAYSIGITNVDPVKYNLLFERFLNPERVTMPDIDVDFIDSKRDRVFDYIIEKYGKERSARVIAFSTLTAKACIRQVAKALGCSLAEVNDLSKKFSDDSEGSLTEMANQSPSFLSAIKTNDKYKKVFDTALKLENLPRQTTLHASGFLISDEPLVNTIPVYQNSSETLTTQYDLNYLEEFNLYKMDLLGLTNLSIIEECIQKIKEIFNIKININNIDYDDPNIYKPFNNNQYAGIFQFDKNSIKRASNVIKPTSLLDIAAVLAIGRPGPMKFVETFARRKRGLERIRYIHPSLEPILKETYGIMIYQEQIIQVLTKMANFTLGKADIVRRGISKKNEAILKSAKDDFIKGCTGNGYTIKEAEDVYDNILQFAEYGFNKSHSIAYGMLSLQLSYLKVYYPSVFFASLMNVSFDENKLNNYYAEMKQYGVRLLPPYINKALDVFRATNNTVIFALGKIKDLNNTAVKVILKERENGFYKDFVDFVVRTTNLGITKENIIALIEAGCFDEFKINRTSLLASLDTVLMYAVLAAKRDDQLLLIDESINKPNIRIIAENMDEISLSEKNRIGVYLTNHPLLKQRQKLKNAGYVTVSEYKTGATVMSVLKINAVRSFNTKNGERMASIEAEDETGFVNLVIFPSKYDLFKSLFEKGNYIQIKGKVDTRNDELSVLVDLMRSYKGSD